MEDERKGGEREGKGAFARARGSGQHAEPLPLSKILSFINLLRFFENGRGLACCGNRRLRKGFWE